MSFEIFSYGNPDADILLLQMVDDHDLAVIESEVGYIRELSCGQDFCLRAVKVNNWFDDLSPWEAPAVFGNENPVMAQVGTAIRETEMILRNAGKACVLEWNKGNHFKEPDLRTAKAFAWLMNRELEMS